MTTLMTIEKAIAARLEQKRRKAEQEAREEAEREALEQKKEFAIAEQARAILSSHYKFDLYGVEVSADLMLEGEDGIVSYFRIAISFPGGHSVSTNSDVIARELTLDQEALLSVKWYTLHAVRPHLDDYEANTSDDLLEAIIFAKYGTFNPKDEDEQDEIDIPF